MELYHYTDQNGFIGIIGNKNLWATKVQYLNDNNEFHLALSIAKEQLEKLHKTKRSKNELDRIGRLNATLKNIKNINMCVCSLSEKGDLLSQWRGYSSGLGGYSIGFKKDILETVALRNNFQLRKCIYDKKQQVKIIKDLIIETLSKFSDYEEPNTEFLGCSSKSSDYFNDQLAKLAPIIKDSSFSEESEWRLISSKGLCLTILDYRVGRSMLTPYFKIQFKEAFKKALSKVVVGHTPHEKLAISATEMFLYKHVGNIHVKASLIPYRNW